MQKNRAPLTFTAEALQVLTAFPWPENLTQLAQAIDDAVNHAVLVSSIQVNHLPVAVRTFASIGLSAQSRNLEPIDLDQVLLDLERTIVMRALKLLPSQSRCSCAFARNQPRPLAEANRAIGPQFKLTFSWIRVDCPTDHPILFVGPA